MSDDNRTPNFVDAQPLALRGPRSARSLAQPEREPCDILIVDDRAANRTALEVALDGVSCRAVMATSGSDALRQLLARDFAVILLDVHMPGMSGLETARLIRARERSRHVPIIFVTAGAHDAREVLEGYRLEAVDFLFKPVRPEILRAKVNVLVTLEQRRRVIERQARELRAHELQERRHGPRSSAGGWRRTRSRNTSRSNAPTRRSSRRSTAGSRSRINARTSSSRPSATSCAILWRRS